MPGKTFFTTTNIQMLSMGFVGLVIIIMMSLYVGSNVHENTRGTASLDVPISAQTDAQGQAQTDAR